MMLINKRLFPSTISALLLIHTIPAVAMTDYELRHPLGEISDENLKLRAEDYLSLEDYTLLGVDRRASTEHIIEAFRFMQSKLTRLVPSDKHAELIKALMKAKTSIYIKAWAYEWLRDNVNSAITPDAEPWIVLSCNETEDVETVTEAYTHILSQITAATPNQSEDFPEHEIRYIVRLAYQTIYRKLLKRNEQALEMAKYVAHMACASGWSSSIEAVSAAYAVLNKGFKSSAREILGIIHADVSQQDIWDKFEMRLRMYHGMYKGDPLYSHLMIILTEALERSLVELYSAEMQRETKSQDEVKYIESLLMRASAPIRSLLSVSLACMSAKNIEAAHARYLKAIAPGSEFEFIQRELAQWAYTVLKQEAQILAKYPQDFQSSTLARRFEFDHKLQRAQRKGAQAVFA